MNKKEIIALLHVTLHQSLEEIGSLAAFPSSLPPSFKPAEPAPLPGGAQLPPGVSGAAWSQPRLPEQRSAEVLHLFGAADPLVAQQGHGLVAVLLNLLDLLVAECSPPGAQRLGGIPGRHHKGLG